MGWFPVSCNLCDSRYGGRAAAMFRVGFASQTVEGSVRRRGKATVWRPVEPDRYFWCDHNHLFETDRPGFLDDVAQAAIGAARSGRGRAAVDPMFFDGQPVTRPGQIVEGQRRVARIFETGEFDRRVRDVRITITDGEMPIVEATIDGVRSRRRYSNGAPRK